MGECRRAEDNHGVPSHVFAVWGNGSRCQCGDMEIFFGQAVRVEGVRMAEYAGSDPT